MLKNGRGRVTRKERRDEKRWIEEGGRIIARNSRREAGGGGERGMDGLERWRWGERKE